MGFKYKSEWEYDTSEDTSVSLFASVSWGTLVLQKINNPKAKMRLKYHCVSIGNGKGLPANFSKSTLDFPSYGNTVVADKIFDEQSFPCRGYILGAGAGGLLDDGSHGPNAGNVTMFLFGIIPVFAGVRSWGGNYAVLPGAGLSAGIASFEVV